nr:truncated GidB [Mycobacterium tuberculosis]
MSPIEPAASAIFGPRLGLARGTPKRWRDPVWSGGWWDPAKSVGYGTGIY